MSAPEITRRKHVLVELIEAELNRNPNLLQHPRIDNLPEMVLRHGVLQTVAFLKSKSLDSNKKTTLDAALFKLLEDCVKRTTDSELAPAKLAKLDLKKYMMVNEVAIEAASWIALLAKARNGG